MNLESSLPPNDDMDVRANRFDIVSRLADDLAHEIKNPLNSIVINLEVLKVRAARGDGSGAIERAGVIEQETRRLHIMIDRLLQLLRPDRDSATGFALDRILDELTPLIEACTRLARNSFSIEGDAAVMVPLRRDAFKFAMLNVLTAVHDHLGEGGGTLVLRCHPDADRVRLDVIARRDPDAGPPNGDERWADSARTAAAFLRDTGVRVDRRSDGISFDLPGTGPADDPGAA